jgi:gliding motility-associated-like protein
VYNVTDDKYIDCGSFEFVASSNLPGFSLSRIGKDVYYQPWAPVTVNLVGLAGKTIRLEFSTNDCVFTQHFGYAYIDVNEDCGAEPISGNTYCGGAQSIHLTAPFGFASYSWYNSDFSQLLGNENILTLPPPPANTTYAVVVTPYEGVGCLDTLYTTIHVSPDPFKLEVMAEITGCPMGIDLTAASITAGSTPKLTFSYYTNLSQTNYVPVPSVITSSGIYYIKGVNSAGCNDIKPINVTIIEPPRLIISNPAGVCIPQKIDITNPAITSGSDPGLNLSYWKDGKATIPLTNPTAVAVAGTYYIRAIKPGSCGIIKPVELKIGEVPTFIINHPVACGKVNLTDEDVTAGSTFGLFYSYWMDALATIILKDPENIKATGTYYIMASSSSGCSIIRAVNITVHPIPTFTVVDPSPAVYPVMTIDLTTAVNNNIGLTYTYWLDSLTRKPVSNPRAVVKRDRYFIRGTNEFGCIYIQPVNAIIIPPPEPIVYVPTAFTPNNDGLNDDFKIKIIGETSVNHFRIYNRWGQIVYENKDMTKSWNGKFKGVEIPSGVYIWMMDGIDTYFKKPFTQKGLVTLIR